MVMSPAPTAALLVSPISRAAAGIKLLLDETEAPEKYGKYDYYVVLFQLAKLKDEKLKPIFDDAQRQAMRKPPNRAKKWS